MRDLRMVRAKCIELGLDGGAFTLPSPADGALLRIIASHGLGWDHVSVSRARRCPNWTEMEAVARVFFADDEVAIQMHVPRSDHINQHPYCLHWWRPNDGREIPRPPSIMVGVADDAVNALALAREAWGV